MSLNNFKQQIKNDTTLTENSKRNYLTKIELLIKKGLPINNTEEQIISKLKEAYPKANSTYKSMLYPIIKYRELTDLPVDKLKEEYTTITKDYLEKQEDQTTDKPLITLKELKKLKKKIEKDNIQFKLLFSLYTEHPPVRNDYYNVKYQNYDTEKDNFYDKNNKTIIINEFKTSKYYEPIKVALSRSETTLINKLIKRVSNDFIFYNSKGEIYNDKSFSKYLIREFKKISGIGLGSSDLRKIYITDNNNKSLKERKEIATKMGHDVYTAELHYKKINLA